MRWTLALITAIAIAGCGVSSQSPDRGRIADQRTESGRLACLQQAHLPVTEVGSTGLQIGSAPVGPRVVFTPSLGSSQDAQMRGNTQGAEVIGTALLYPNQASDKELTTIENCLSRGVRY
jgi:hypothetical protein